MARKTKQKTKGGPRVQQPILSKVLPADVNRVVAAAELVGVHLIGCNAQMNMAEMSPALPNLAVLPPMFRANFSKGVLYCGVKTRVEVSGKGETPMAFVEAEYSLLYRLEDGVECSDEMATYFAGRTGVFNAWPFFRELVFSMGAKMCIPPLVLPLFKLPLERPPTKHAEADSATSSRQQASRQK